MVAAAIVVIMVGGCNVGRGYCGGGSSNGGVAILMVVVRLLLGGTSYLDNYNFKS